MNHGAGLSGTRSFHHNTGTLPFPLIQHPGLDDKPDRPAEKGHGRVNAP